MRGDQLFHAICKALSPQECGVCAQALDGIKRFLDGYMYERVNDPWSRAELIDACTRRTATAPVNSGGRRMLALLHDLSEFWPKHDY
jgi:hypothetical protein